MSVQVKYEDLLYINYKKNITLISFVIVIIALLIVSFNTKVYSSNEYEAIFDGNYLNVTLLYNDTEAVTNGKYLEINNESFDYEIVSYSEVFSIGEYYYQSISISLEKTLIENEVVNLKVFYDKDKMINKIIDLIF